MSWMMPDCKETHRLVSDHLDRELSLAERMRMRVHLAMCASCTSFLAQMKLIRAAIRRYPGPDRP